MGLAECARALGVGYPLHTIGGLSTGAKAGIGIGSAVAAGVVGLCSYLLWKHYKGTPKPPAGDPEGNASQPTNPQDHEHHPRRPRIRREEEDEDKHHHHNGQQQECTDEKCFLNNEDHKCSNPKEECACNCTDPLCPLNSPDEKRKRREKQRKKEFANTAKDEGGNIVMQEPKSMVRQVLSSEIM